MPKVPTIGGQPGIRGRPTSSRLAAVPGRAAAQLAQVGQAIAQDALQRKRSSEFVRLSAVLAGKSNEIERSFENDPDTETAPMRYAESARIAFDETMRNVSPDAELQGAMQANFNRTLEAGIGRVAAESRGRRIALTKASLIAGQDESAKSAALSKTPDELAELLENDELQIAAAVASRDMTEAEAVVARGAQGERLTGIVIGNAIQDDPEAALESLGDAEQWTGLSGEQRAKGIFLAEKEIAQLEATENADFSANLEDRVRSGIAGFSQIDAGRERIGPQKWVELREIVRNREAIEATKVAGRQLVLDTLDGEAFLDPKNPDHRKAVNDFAADVILPMLGNPDVKPDMKSKIVTQFMARTGMVPKALQGIMRGQLRAGTPEDAVDAARMIDNLNQPESLGGNPRALRDFAQTDIELGIMVNNFKKAGLSDEAAVEFSRAATDNLTPAKRSLRRDLFSDQTRDDPNAEWLTDEIGELGGIRGFFTFGDDIKIPDAMHAEFNMVAEESFQRTGSLDDSREFALTQLQNVWGMTELGNRRWQKFAPEVVYSMSTDDIREQLLTEIQAAADAEEEAGAVTEISNTILKGEDFDRLRLQIDPATSRERRPSYQVLFLSDDGFNKVLPQTWRPDFASSPAMQRITERRAKDLSEAKKRREFMASNPSNITVEHMTSQEPIIQAGEGFVAAGRRVASRLTDPLSVGPLQRSRRVQ